VGSTELERLAELALAQPTAEQVQQLLDDLLAPRLHDLLAGWLEAADTA
jgi:hypothetical protein